MNASLLLPISMLACLLQGTINKIYSGIWNDHAVCRYIYTLSTGLISAIILLAWGGIGHVSSFTLLLGLLFGIVTALQSVFLLQALELGSYAYTVVFTSLSMLIPTLSGCIFWGETIETQQVLGILFVIICLILSVERLDKKAGISLRWLMSSGGAFICGGMIGVLQKIHQSSSYQEELNPFLVSAFLFSSIVSAVACGISVKRRGRFIPDKKTIFPILALLLIAGACIAVNNKLNLYLSGVMNSALFFPLVNGGHIVLTTLAAVVIFRSYLQNFKSSCRTASRPCGSGVSLRVRA